MPNYKDIIMSISIEDYLKTIWLIAREEVASTSAVADQLGVAAPSVSAMLGKLQEAGFVSHERYRGVKLTPRGRHRALRLLRRHRLIETFLLEHLGYSWTEVHGEAERLEHAVSDHFTEELARFLNHPSHDPHGDPIPNADGTLPDTPNVPLAEVEIGQVLRVSRLLSQASDVLSYLAGLNIKPGVQLEVTGREPLGGLVYVTTQDGQAVLSKDLAMLIRGAVLP